MMLMAGMASHRFSRLEAHSAAALPWRRQTAQHRGGLVCRAENVRGGRPPAGRAGGATGGAADEGERSSKPYRQDRPGERHSPRGSRGAAGGGGGPGARGQRSGRPGRAPQDQGQGSNTGAQAQPATPGPLQGRHAPRQKQKQPPNMPGQQQPRQQPHQQQSQSKRQVPHLPALSDSPEPAPWWQPDTAHREAPPVHDQLQPSMPKLEQQQQQYYQYQQQQYQQQRKQPQPQSAQLDWRTYRARLVALDHAGLLTAPGAIDAATRPPVWPPGAAQHHRPWVPPSQQHPQQLYNNLQQQQQWQRHFAASSYLGAAELPFCPLAWAHELPGPEPGALLLAAPSRDRASSSSSFTDASSMSGDKFGAQQTPPLAGGLFERGVVLLLAHSAAGGAAGLLLNKACPLSGADVSGGLQGNDAAAGALAAFSGQRLYLGGPVHTQHVSVLHQYQGLKGAQRVCEGVYLGGLSDAAALVRAGLAPPEDFALFLGMAGWAPGQLEEELAAGAWHLAAAGPGLTLPQHSMMTPPVPTTTGSSAATSAGMLAGAPLPAAALGAATAAASDALWRRLLSLIRRTVRTSPSSQRDGD